MSLEVHKTHSENVDILKAKVDSQKVGLLCRTMMDIIPLDPVKDFRGGTIAIIEDKLLKSVPTRLPVCYPLRSTNKWWFGGWQTGGCRNMLRKNSRSSCTAVSLVLYVPCTLWNRNKHRPTEFANFVTVKIRLDDVDIFRFGGLRWAWQLHKTPSECDWEVVSRKLGIGSAVTSRLGLPS